MKYTHPTSSAESGELTDPSNPVTPTNHADKYKWRTSNELSALVCCPQLSYSIRTIDYELSLYNV